MSELRDMQRDIVTDREPGTQELCKNLVDGTMFNAEYDPQPDFNLLTDLGDDNREAAKIHISDAAAAAKLARGQRIAVFLYGQWWPFTVLKRTNNPGTPQAEFTLQYKPPVDQ